MVGGIEKPVHLFHLIKLVVNPDNGRAGVVWRFQLSLATVLRPVDSQPLKVAKPLPSSGAALH